MLNVGPYACDAVLRVRSGRFEVQYDQHCVIRAGDELGVDVFARLDRVTVEVVVSKKHACEACKVPETR